MKRLGRHFLDALSQMLDPDEREAVLGDFEETRQTAGRAVRELLGLIARREALRWKARRPWVVLLVVALPITAALSDAASRLAEGTAVYSFIYVNNWTWGQLESEGARRVLVQETLGYLGAYVSLAASAWSAGFAIGTLASRTTRGTAAFLYVSVVATWLVPRSHWIGNAAVFDVPFYRFVLPVIVGALVVVAPSASGLRNAGAFDRRLSVGKMLFVASLLGLTVRAALVRHWGAPMANIVLDQIPFIVLAWPTAFVAGVVLRQCLHRPGKPAFPSAGSDGSHTEGA